MKSVTNLCIESEDRELPLYHSLPSFTKQAPVCQNLPDKKLHEKLTINSPRDGQHSTVSIPQDDQYLQQLEPSITSPSSTLMSPCIMSPGFKEECCIDSTNQGIDNDALWNNFPQIKWMEDDIASSMFFESMADKLEHWTKSENGVLKDDIVVDIPAAPLTPTHTPASRNVLSPRLPYISLPLCDYSSTGTELTSRASVDCTNYPQKGVVTKSSRKQHEIAGMNIDEFVHENLLAWNKQQSYPIQHPATPNSDMVADTPDSFALQTNDDIRADFSAPGKPSASNSSHDWSLNLRSEDLSQTNDTLFSSVTATSVAYPPLPAVDSTKQSIDAEYTGCDLLNSVIPSWNDVNGNGSTYQTHGLTNERTTLPDDVFSDTQAFHTADLFDTQNYQSHDSANRQGFPSRYPSNYQACQPKAFANNQDFQTQNLAYNQSCQMYDLTNNQSYQGQYSSNYQAYQPYGMTNSQAYQPDLSSKSYNDAVQGLSSSSIRNINWNTHLPQVIGGSSTTNSIPRSTVNKSSRFIGRDPKRDQLLLNLKEAGLSYKDIKTKGNFQEAESTLRGRYRTLTKDKDQRVRKPEWTDRDIMTLKDTVNRFLPSAGHGGKVSHSALSKVPWKQVADTMHNRGCYRYGNATVKKKYVEVMGIKGE